MSDGSELNQREHGCRPGIAESHGAAKSFFEAEAGVVGGEEDGDRYQPAVGHEKLYTTPEDMLLRQRDCLKDIGRFTPCGYVWQRAWRLQAGNVKLDPLDSESRNVTR